MDLTTLSDVIVLGVSRRVVGDVTASPRPSGSDPVSWR